MLACTVLFVDSVARTACAPQGMCFVVLHGINLNVCMVQSWIVVSIVTVCQLLSVGEKNTSEYQTAFSERQTHEQ